MNTSRTPEPPDTCFVCVRPVDRRGLENIRAPLACLECKSRARLASTNALLSDVLHSERPYPLEGSGLASFLNPLLIDGRRAWADYTAGGVATFEEVFPSRDYFDFVVQHVEPVCDILEAFSALRDMDESIRIAVVKWLEGQPDPVRKAFLDNLGRVEDLWDLSRGAEWALELQGPILTNADAWRVLDAAPGIDPFGERLKTEMLNRLQELSARSG